MCFWVNVTENMFTNVSHQRKNTFKFGLPLFAKYDLINEGFVMQSHF